MRPIEFRGKDIISRHWVNGDVIHGVGAKSGKVYILPRVINLAYVKNCHPLDGVEVDPATVGQFTGLQDKNGKKIFEGDKLLCYHNEFDIAFGAVVFFDNSTFMLYEILEDGTKKAFRYWNDGIHDWYSMEQFDSFELEIIGNIHDNPELLNQQQ